MYKYLKTLHDAFYGHIELHQNEETGELLVMKKMNSECMGANVYLNGVRMAEDAFNEIIMAQFLSARPHRNIIQFKGCYFTRTDCFLLMEYCSGGDLFTFNEQIHSCQMPESLIQRMFTEIISGVEHLHSFGLAHRDISLENVFLDGNLHCKLADFGLAAQDGSVCRGKVGKPFYMAPEVYQDSSCSYDGLNADIWSLGVLLFILFTGNPPFEVSSVEDERFQVIQRYGVRELLELDQAKVPELAIDLMEKMLVCSPNQRVSIKEVVAHPFFLQPKSLPRSNSWKKMSLILQNNVPCSSCPSIIRIGHRKRSCQSCNQIFCSSCHKKHTCRFIN